MPFARYISLFFCPLFFCLVLFCFVLLFHGTLTAQSVYQHQPVHPQPDRVASNAPTGQSIPLYAPASPHTPTTVQPGVEQYHPNTQSPQTLTPQTLTSPSPPHSSQPHAGREPTASPQSRVVPFSLTPGEQRELDEFLARWERYSASIKRYDVEFDVFDYDATTPGAQPEQPQRICFGYFKYISNPMRFLYVIEGEWRDKKKVQRDGDKNPHIYAEKMIIDEKSVFKYDYNAKTVYQVNVPPELIGQGIDKSPLPLIFGAKANDLKRRFSLKLEHPQTDIAILYARPLLIDDQQEFLELEIMLDKNMRAKALRKHDINGTSHKVYNLKTLRTNTGITDIIGHIKDFFTPDVPRGWQLQVHEAGAESTGVGNREQETRVRR